MSGRRIPCISIRFCSGLIKLVRIRTNSMATSRKSIVAKKKMFKIRRYVLTFVPTVLLSRMDTDLLPYDLLQDSEEHSHTGDVQIVRLVGLDGAKNGEGSEDGLDHSCRASKMRMSLIVTVLL